MVVDLNGGPLVLLTGGGPVLVDPLGSGDEVVKLSWSNGAEEGTGERERKEGEGDMLLLPVVAKDEACDVVEFERG